MKLKQHILTTFELRVQVVYRMRKDSIIFSFCFEFDND